MENIGEVDYASYEAQKNEIRATTERSINSLFRKGILNQEQAKKLLAMYLMGKVSFGIDGLTEEEANNFTIESYNEIEQNIETVRYNLNSKTLYIIQPGDTADVIAAKMGLEGEAAEVFKREIIQNARKKNMYYTFKNNVEGFKVGDIIELPGDYRDKIEELKNKGEYNETTKDLDNAYTLAIGNRPHKEKPEPSDGEDGETTPPPPPRVTRPPFGVEDRGREAQGPTEAQKNAAKKVYDEAVQIVKTLGNPPSINDPVLKRINPGNVVFVIKMYYDTYGVQLAKALVKRGDKRAMVVYNKLCHNLCARAKQLGLTGIYFGDAQKCIDHPDKMYAWLDKVYPKVLGAEKKKNPAFVNESDYETSRKRVEYEDTTKLRTDSTKIAKDLHGALHDSYEGSLRERIAKTKENWDNSVTKKILGKITPSNVAFVIQIYKKQYKKSLAHDIHGEWIGLGMKDIKDKICSKLVTQAKKLNITNYSFNYAPITNIDKLANWMESLSNRIITIMDGNSSTLPQDDPEETTTPRPGGGIIKTITNGQMFVEADITKVVEEYDSNGNKIQATIYYKDGKEVLEKYEKNAKTGKVELKQRILLKRGTSTRKPQSSGITEPVPMEIKLPDNANENARKFAKALERNKRRLMSLLKIDNDTFNRLAKLAMAIAEQETSFGRPDVLSWGGVKYYGEAAHPILAEAVSKGKPLSFGSTQIKFDLHSKDADVKRLWNSLGITRGVQLFDIENSAIATIALLSVLSKRAKGQKIQDGMEAANGRVITHTGWEKKNGTLVNTGNTKSYVNQVDEDDVICYMWNKGSTEILNGTMDPLGSEYTRNVRQYKKKYEIKESEADRRAARGRSQQVTKPPERISFTPMDNNGPMGSIIFMPIMYSDKPVNNEKEIKILKEGLKKNTHNIKQSDKDELIKAVENHEIAFEFGLTEEEVLSLTQSDVDKLLKRLRILKQKIESETTVRFSDKISPSEAKILSEKYMKIIRQSEYNFKREYLNSRSRQVRLSDVDSSNVVQLNNNLPYIPNTRNRRGFVGNITDSGVNTSGTTEASAALAKAAQNTSARMTKEAKQRGKTPGGMCMTGFRQALRAAGIDDSDLKESAPRTAVMFFERHPDMFEEVKWINTGNGSGRQINSTDLPKLPAGYIVIWIPDPRFSKKEGHISITNGNGQAYSDETDNLDWGGYAGKDWTGKDASGKGEHGYFRVFRLTNKWSVDPNTGKLVFNK